MKGTADGNWTKWLATGAASSMLVSNAACQILIGAAFLALLMSEKRVRLPPVVLPFCLFLLGTLLSQESDDESVAVRAMRRVL